MKTRAKISLILIVIVALVTVGTVAAQEIVPTGTPTACSGDLVAGTVVSAELVDGVWTVVILTESEPTAEGTSGELNLCTVTLTDEDLQDGEVTEGHPIVILLTNAFGDGFDVDGDELQDSGDAPEVCLSQATPDSYILIDCPAEAAPGVIDGKVLEYIADDSAAGGTVKVLITTEDGNLLIVDVPVSADELPQELTLDDLQNLNLPDVNWHIDESGNFLPIDDKIASYHEDGIGFGVLVKLFSMAEELGVPVDELIEEFQSGTGLGQMFKEHGKPPWLGVGHVRNDKESKGQGPKQEAITEETSDTTVTANGPGNKPDVPPGQLKKQQDNQSTGLQNQGTGNGKPGKSNNGKAKGKP